MKGCFSLPRKFAPIGHEIILHLRKSGVNEFCAYVQMRTAYNFLKSQTDISYTGLLLDEDIFEQYKHEKLDVDYIKWLEKEYGLPNLWPYLYLDRVIMQNQLIREYPYDKPLLSHEEMLTVTQCYAKAIISFLDKERPDFIVFTAIGSLGGRLLYQIAQKKGIKILIIDYTRVENRLTISEDYHFFTNIVRTFDESMSSHMASPYEEKARIFLNDFQDKPKPYIPKLSPEFRQISRAQQIKFLLPRNLLKTLKWNVTAIFRYLTKNERDYSDENPFLSLWDKMKRKIRGLYGFSDLYSKMDDRDEFAFFGLHMEPETATLLYAPYYTDQIQLIKNIARSLPVHFKLYVKDHPYMVGFRTRSYYRQLLKIPNVKLLNPSIKSFEIITKASLVVGITGTTLWEALLLKKPVISFGDVFYNKLSMSKRCASLEELPYIIQEQLYNFHYNEREVINFLAAVFANSTPVDLLNMLEDEDQGENFRTDENLKRLAELLERNLNLKQ